MLPGHLAMNVRPGNSTGYAVANCHANEYAMNLDWTTEEYSFAESYSVWGWV
jgi:hypothetical protein